MDFINYYHKFRLHVILLFGVLLFDSYSDLLRQEWILMVSFLIGISYIYIINKFFDKNEDVISQPEHAIVPSKKWFILVVVGGLVPLFFVSQPIYYLTYIVLGTLYSMPVYKHIRIKNIFLLKNIWSALFVWTLPFYVLDLDIGQHDVNGYITLFIFVVVIELLWDLRDIEGDRKQKVRTFPVVFGWNKTKLLMILLVLTNFFVFSSSLYITVLLSLTIPFFSKITDNLWYHAMLYGIMVVILIT